MVAESLFKLGDVLCFEESGILLTFLAFDSLQTTAVLEKEAVIGQAVEECRLIVQEFVAD